MSIILSIKPCFSDQIYLLNKPLELRKKLGKYFTVGRTLYIYSSSPVKAITGSAEIEAIERLPVASIKRHYLKLACIGEVAFDSYYQGHDEGSILWLKNVKKFNNPIILEELRNYGFIPPQSFSYLKGDLEVFIESKK